MPWPRFYAQVGPYAAQTPQEIKTMAQLGFHFALLDDKIGHGDAITKYNIKYISTEPWWEIYDKCRSLVKQSGSCPAAQERNVLDRIRKSLAADANNSNLIGYWVLGDYPGGDIRPILRKIHTLVAERNKTSPFPRPTICGFGGQQGLVNFDPAACDMIAIYLYQSKPRLSLKVLDWSLSGALPAMLDELKTRGWDPQKEPLIGMPQAFGGCEGLNWVTPSTDNMALQAETYCRAGAIALLPYTWHDSTKVYCSELYNTPSLVSGLQRGKQICEEKYWK